MSELEERTPGVCRQIEQVIETNGRARILEVGCGFGAVLLELAMRFGARVELHGINRKPDDGNAEIMEWNAQRLGVPICPDLHVHYVDANGPLPFPDRSFDVVFSQVSYLYIAEKLFFLKEVGRILADDGIARLDIGDVDSPNPRKNWIEIWSDGHLLAFRDLIARTPGWFFDPAGINGHLVIRKPARATDGDELVATLPLARLNREWVGIRSIYRCEPFNIPADQSVRIFALAPIHKTGFAYEACLPRIDGREAGFVTEDGRPVGGAPSSRPEVESLGEGRWCIEDSALGTSIFLSATAGMIDDHVYRLAVPMGPVHR